MYQEEIRNPEGVTLFPRHCSRTASLSNSEKFVRDTNSQTNNVQRGITILLKFHCRQINWTITIFLSNVIPIAYGLVKIISPLRGSRSNRLHGFY